MERCVLWEEPFTSSKPTTVHQKGFTTLLRICNEEQFEIELINELKGRNKNGDTILVHAECRKKLTDKRECNIIENQGRNCDLPILTGKQNVVCVEFQLA